MTIRFLLDEHIDHVVRRELLRREPEINIKVIGETNTPARSTPDPELLLWCEKNAYTLVTNNRRTMPEHLKDHFQAGHQMPGILLLRPSITLGQLITELLAIWRANQPERFHNLLVYLPLSA
ncbi:MAG TPA: DUF5615 family PIN-like protein [Chloroflexi bacterium]|nr:DUF5615 family PIN-like protein [Chloroflexota bacterium]